MSEAVPFEGYDDLTAKEVVERLEQLGEAEIEAVKAYEAAHQNRKTVLAFGEQPNAEQSHELEGRPPLAEVAAQAAEAEQAQIAQQEEQ